MPKPGTEEDRRKAGAGHRGRTTSPREKPTFLERNLAFDLAYEVELHGDWVGLSLLVYSTAQASELRARERRLLLDIYREGVVL